MAKRVSMKGKGAAIFFGDDPIDAPLTPAAEMVPVIDSQPPADAAPEAADSIGVPGRLPEPHADSAQDGPDARVQEGMHARTHARARERRPAPPAPAPPPPPSLPHEVLDAVEGQVADRATITNAFRYTEAELTALTDALYALNKRRPVKLSKQDVARLGLNAVLWDYEVHGETSLLAELARRKNRRRGGES